MGIGGPPEILYFWEYAYCFCDTLWILTFYDPQMPKPFPSQAAVRDRIEVLPDGSVEYVNPLCKHIPVGKTLCVSGSKPVTMAQAVAILRGEETPYLPPAPRRLTPEQFDAEIREAVSYDPSTGLLTPTGKYKVRVGVGNGYVLVFGLGRATLGHRLAWFLAHGVWPPRGICTDHINGDRLDNRLCNLRLATYQQNFTNTRMSKRNSSGVKGVRREGKRWAAIICHNYTSHRLGTFDSLEEASAAYRAAAERLHGEFASHLSRPTNS